MSPCSPTVSYSFAEAWIEENNSRIHASETGRKGATSPVPEYSRSLAKGATAID